MSLERLEPNDSIVGDASFGLTDKDAKFTRWDARKFSRRSFDQQPGLLRRVALFEDTTNDVLLSKMNQLHESIAEMEADGLDMPKILVRLLTDTPDLNDYGLLLRKTDWGERLIKALYPETYRQDEDGALWSDFVVGRIHRALGGELERIPRYDGRFSYQIDASLDVLYFSPESNAHANDGPELHIRGNRKEKEYKYGFDTDRKFSTSIQNVTSIQVYESAGRIDVIKDMKENYLRLIYYRQVPVGSSNQLNIDLITKNSPHF